VLWGRNGVVIALSLLMNIVSVIICLGFRRLALADHLFLSRLRQPDKLRALLHPLQPLCVAELAKLAQALVTHVILAGGVKSLGGLRGHGVCRRLRGLFRKNHSTRHRCQLSF
jgi:hypothetical protein